MAYITVGKENSSNIDLYYRRPWHRKPSNPNPRIPTQRSFLGEASSSTPGCRPACHHL